MTNGILHLTVNAYGVVSLWDSPAAARVGKDKDEVQIQLSLTVHQIREIAVAERLAMEKKHELQKRLV